jgi:hypothetical protein
MSPALELSYLLEQVAEVDIDTIWRTIDEHEFMEDHAGNGYTEPREHWIDCTKCMETVWGWQQYYAETDEDPEQAKKRHLIMVLVEAVLNEGKPNNTEEN